MLTALLIALKYPFQLIVGPAFILALAVCLVLLLRFSRLRGVVCGVLVLLGLSEWIALQSTLFIWGYIVATVTLFIGAIGGSAYLLVWLHNRRNNLIEPLGVKLNPRLKNLKKAVYLSLSIVILLSTIVISARAANFIVEDYRSQENFPSHYNSPNLTLNGTIQYLDFNYTVDTGFSYHTFTAYITLRVEEIISGYGWWSNNTSLYQDLSHGDLLVCFDNAQTPNLAVGQKIEVCGYLCPWMEDSIYSEKFVVAASINGSYLNPL
ncbi:MAG: hypothetical protein ACQCN6_00875 [Candidatus Bathyarchaeia archaeon]|jgi:hypothetical protein